MGGSIMNESITRAAGELTAVQYTNFFG
jgi:hypothetical protein